jgi:hypothetical protein
MVISSMMLVDVAECYPLVSLQVYPFQERRKDSSRRGRRTAASTAPRLPVRWTANARSESGPKSVPMLIVLFMLPFTTRDGCRSRLLLCTSKNDWFFCRVSYGFLM